MSLSIGNKVKSLKYINSCFIILLLILVVLGWCLFSFELIGLTGLQSKDTISDNPNHEEMTFSLFDSKPVKPINSKVNKQHQNTTSGGRRHAALLGGFRQQQQLRQQQQQETEVSKNTTHKKRNEDIPLIPLWLLFARRSRVKFNSVVSAADLFHLRGRAASN